MSGTHYTKCKGILITNELFSTSFRQNKSQVISGIYFEISMQGPAKGVLLARFSKQHSILSIG